MTVFGDCRSPAGWDACVRPAVLAFFGIGGCCVVQLVANLGVVAWLKCLVAPNCDAIRFQEMYLEMAPFLWVLFVLDALVASYHSKGAFCVGVDVRKLRSSVELVI